MTKKTIPKKKATPPRMLYRVQVPANLYFDVQATSSKQALKQAAKVQEELADGYNLLPSAMSSQVQVYYPALYTQPKGSCDIVTTWKA
jgi:hypothetical protein